MSFFTPLSPKVNKGLPGETDLHGKSAKALKQHKSMENSSEQEIVPLGSEN
jgi:hypothetical protein